MGSNVTLEPTVGEANQLGESSTSISNTSSSGSNNPDIINEAHISNVVGSHGCSGTIGASMGPSTSSQSNNASNLEQTSAFTAPSLADALHASARPQLIPRVDNYVPLGGHVPLALKDKIWQGAYIDLSLLLQDSAAAVLASRILHLS